MFQRCVETTLDFVFLLMLGQGGRKSSLAHDPMCLFFGHFVTGGFKDVFF